jgi:hypothetical protein
MRGTVGEIGDVRAMTQKRAGNCIVTVLGNFEVSCCSDLQSAAEIGAP